MSTPPTQSFANHARFVPLFHFVTGSINAVLVVWALYRAASFRTPTDVFALLVATALMLHFIYIRTFPLAVQDRVIRLEEQLRLERLLPAESRHLAGDLSPAQLIALRFASDAELPALAKRVSEQKITERKAIKAMITNWRADHMRA